jgi:hypothetical protein
MKSFLRTMLPAFLLMACMGGSALAQHQDRHGGFAQNFRQLLQKKLGSGRHPGTRHPARQG